MLRSIPWTFIETLFLAVMLAGCASSSTQVSASPTTAPPTSTPSPNPPTSTLAPTPTETPIPTPTPLALPIELAVPADAGWFATGLVLPSEQSLLLTSEGIVDYNGTDPNSGRSGPNGDGSSCDKAAIEAIVGGDLEIDCLITGVSWGALVGRIEDGEPFLIGRSHELTIELAGELLLGVNDCCSLADNIGEFQVIISSP